MGHGGPITDDDPMGHGGPKTDDDPMGRDRPMTNGGRTSGQEANGEGRVAFSRLRG